MVARSHRLGDLPCLSRGATSKVARRGHASSRSRTSAPPTPISTSPIEKTLASGMRPWAGRRCRPGTNSVALPVAIAELRVVGRRQRDHALPARRRHRARRACSRRSRRSPRSSRPAPTMISQKPGWRRLTTSDINTSVVDSTYSDGPRLPTAAASGELNSSAWKNRPTSATGHSRMCTERERAKAPARGETRPRVRWLPHKRAASLACSSRQIQGTARSCERAVTGDCRCAATWLRRSDADADCSRAAYLDPAERSRQDEQVSRQDHEAEGDLLERSSLTVSSWHDTWSGRRGGDLGSPAWPCSMGGSYQYAGRQYSNWWPLSVNDDLTERLVERQVVHEGNYMDVRGGHRARSPDGRKHTRDIVLHPGAVTIVAILRRSAGAAGTAVPPCGWRGTAGAAGRDAGSPAATAQWRTASWRPSAS